MYRLGLEKVSALTERKGRGNSLKFLDYLVVAVAVITALVIYHVKVIRPLERKCESCIRQVYVVDLDGMVAGARDAAIRAAMNGKAVSASRVADEVRHRLDMVLKHLPRGCLVLDRSAVVKGGTTLGSKADRKR